MQTLNPYSYYKAAGSSKHSTKYSKSHTNRVWVRFHRLLATRIYTRFRCHWMGPRKMHTFWLLWNDSVKSGLRRMTQKSSVIG